MRLLKQAGLDNELVDVLADGVQVGIFWGGQEGLWGKTSQNEFIEVIRTPKVTPARNRREAAIRALREEI